MHLHSMTTDDLSGLLNKGRELLADRFEKTGELDAEQLKELREKTAFVVAEKGMLGKIIDKLSGIDDHLVIYVVKL